MEFIIDHDLHIHSYLSACSRNPEQNPQRMHRYALENGLKQICVTDHFWDAAQGSGAPCYAAEDLEEKRQMTGPLPQSEGVRFLFGVETEMDRTMKLGLSREHFDCLDFVVIPTTHLNMMGLSLNKQEGSSTQSRANLWIKRLEAVLSMDIPFHKTGIAHLTCTTMAYWSRQTELEIYSKIPDMEIYRLMKQAAAVGVGIELNACSMAYKPEEEDAILRFYRIARECGCKFYCGSDAHQPHELDKAKALFQKAVTALALQEEDKFMIQ